MNTGGPAFPGPYVNDKGGLEAVWKQGGMTLRDYFAARATDQDIQRHRYTGEFVDGYAGSHKTKIPVCCSVEEARYKYADAMLKAREQ